MWKVRSEVGGCVTYSETGTSGSHDERIVGVVDHGVVADFGLSLQSKKLSEWCYLTLYPSLSVGLFPMAEEKAREARRVERRALLRSNIFYYLLKPECATLRK